MRTTTRTRRQRFGDLGILLAGIGHQQRLRAFCYPDSERSTTQPLQQLLPF